LLLMMISYLFSQERSLTIYSITEYIDGYKIIGIDSNKSDTLVIISKKQQISDLEKYIILRVGEEYCFQIDDKIKNMSAMPPDNFVVRIVSTVVWRAGDEFKNIPVFARNIKGIYIEREVH